MYSLGQDGNSSFYVIYVTSEENSDTCLCAVQPSVSWPGFCQLKLCGSRCCSSRAERETNLGLVMSQERTKQEVAEMWHNHGMNDRVRWQSNNVYSYLGLEGW